ncbi:MAG: transient receptor potential cation channel subfamily er 1 [Rickettsiales bacterium]|jgi:ankyrin repeat protein|nr:transient receptor potential cation channel subfamily er 1 [Rickettsiales bacterium]
MSKKKHQKRQANPAKQTIRIPVLEVLNSLGIKTDLKNLTEFENILRISHEKRKDDPGLTTLHVSVARESIECVRSLLGVPVFRQHTLNQKNSDGQTPLLLAAIGTPKGNLETQTEIMKLLLAHGANPNLPDNKGYVPLHNAITAEQPDRLKYLVEHIYKKDIKLDLNAQKSEDGYTALHSAIMANSLPMVTTLLDAGADVDILNNDGELPLHLAAQIGNPEIVAKILERTKNPNLYASDDELHAVDIAILANHSPIAKQILEYKRTSATGYLTHLQKRLEQLPSDTKTAAVLITTSFAALELLKELQQTPRIEAICTRITKDLTRITELFRQENTPYNEITEEEQSTASTEKFSDSEDGLNSEEILHNAIIDFSPSTISEETFKQIKEEAYANAWTRIISNRNFLGLSESWEEFVSQKRELSSKQEGSVTTPN